MYNHQSLKLLEPSPHTERQQGVIFFQFVFYLCVCEDVNHDFWNPLIKWPIMSGFQSLRCLSLQDTSIHHDEIGYVWVYIDIYGYV